jgi:sugar/nucleoside kinase (ribokinase family)
MARVLADAQKHGIKTSIDVVSENSDRFSRLVPPSLRYTDYCIINEIETSASTGIPLRGEAGQLLKENLPVALSRLHELGVREWAVIHAPEGGFGIEKSGRYVTYPSIPLHREEIVDKVGAGDAFCAGVLSGAYCGLTIDESIQLGNAAAAMSLCAPGAVAGLESMENTFAFLKKRARPE